MRPPRAIPVLGLDRFGSGDRRAHRRLVTRLGDALREPGFVNIEGHGVGRELLERSVLSAERHEESPGRSRRAPCPLVAESWVLVEGREEELCRQLERCARVVLEAVAEYFGLRSDAFGGMLDGGESRAAIWRRVRDLEPVDRRAGRPSLEPGCDLLGLLCGRGELDLEVRSGEGEWVGARVGCGQVGVRPGEMLRRLTNGVVPAVAVRLSGAGIAPRADVAGSLVSFSALPFRSCDLSVLRAFTGPDRPPAFAPATAGEVCERRRRGAGGAK